MPALGADVLARIQPYMFLAEKIGALHAQLDQGRIDKVEVVFSGDFSELPTVHLTRAVLKGLLDPLLPDSVNYVNAPTLAQRRGIQVIESHRSLADDHSCLLTVRAHTDKEEREICGTVFGRGEIRIVHIDGYRVDIDPKGSMIVTQHNDRPGIIGKVGTLLGNAGVNIAGMNVGREAAGTKALMVLLIDEPVRDALMAEIVKIDGMAAARQVQL
jgi:D-3-phosphoglycerate dehydrogenase